MKESTQKKSEMSRCLKLTGTRLHQVGNGIIRDLDCRPFIGVLELPFYLFAQWFILSVELLGILATVLLIQSCKGLYQKYKKAVGT